MVIFLASSPTEELGNPHPYPVFYERNGFSDRLRQLWPQQARCLMIAADPDDTARNDEMTEYYWHAAENAGLFAACFDLWDGRRAPMTAEQLCSYDAVFLAGGHVPSERRWFEEIKLKELLQRFDGILVGTSAGSMNCAKVVYAWPEMEGESIDPSYELFFDGLGLVETKILPHYQKVKNSLLDGKRLVEDIACSHSRGQKFLAIPDGSYVLVETGRETVFGEAWLITEGRVTQFCQEDECRTVYPVCNLI